MFANSLRYVSRILIPAMTKKILGISAYYHDSAAALVVDGRIVAASMEDRFTRLKHDPSFPVNAIAFCLEAGGIDALQLDAVVFYEQPELKFLRVLRQLISAYPNGARKFAAAMKSWIGEKLWVRAKIVDTLGIDPSIIMMVPHHQSHAAYAFYASPFQSAAILTSDGVGESVSAVMGRGSRDGGLKISSIGEFPNSIGLSYGAITGYLGFRPNDAECSTMALAAFGVPTKLEFFRNLLTVSPQGTLSLAPGYFDFAEDRKSAFLPSLIDTLGPPLDGNPKCFSAFDAAHVASDASWQRGADVAASLQLRTEEILLEQARLLRESSSESCLCLGGGVAMNAVAVGRLVRDVGFDSLFVPPDPGDAGGAVGAAFLGSLRMGVIPPPHSPEQVFIGAPATTVYKLEDFISRVDASLWKRYRSSDATRRVKLRVRNFEDPSAASIHVAAALARGMIAGWISGRAEFGPRALGARSILCDPGRLDVAERMSTLVKNRASFRPYALSVTEEDAGKLFRNDWHQPPFDWMQATIDVRPESRRDVCAALHVDGTTRPHVCRALTQPKFHALLKNFGMHKGVAALLNTSLNEPGQPLINTPEDALIMFARSEMDLLVIENTVIEWCDE